MSGADEKMRALVAKWRDAADAMNVSGKGVWQMAKRECADELEAALAAAQGQPEKESGR